ncbi:uncharacterized protein PRCAT00003629001 [Priceomyces carsonii]|uniref:uncharacterized protein n=1 Tax=Priceomyces carsonii TaxID=28549 RepID=UPI002ED7BB71|nr:unnamed protein product [Priceomyces carsonii]
MTESRLALEQQLRAHVTHLSHSHTAPDLSIMIENWDPRPSLGPKFSNENVINLNRQETNFDRSFPRQYSNQIPDLMTSRNPKRNIYRIIAICVWSFAGGFSDAAPGALLPHMESYYDISYSIVSLIWMSNAVGFITVACFSHKIQPWFGKKKSLCLGCIFSCFMYALVASGTKYPVIVFGFFLGGMGLATVLAQSNVFLSRLDKLSKFLSFFHGSYGIGATVSPLIATSIVNSGIAWHFVYLIMLALMTFSLINLWFSFTGADEDLKPWDFDDSDSTLGSETPNSSLTHINEENIELLTLENSRTKSRNQSSARISNKGEMLLALRFHVTWILSFFVLFYQGSEVSLGGWIVTYLLDYRGGNSSQVGYVASGFWGGLTLGRLVLTRPLHKYFGSRRSVIVCSLLAIGFVILTWVIPNITVASICVSLAGLFIGPSYPLLVTICSQVLPRKIQVVSMTIMTAFGSSGGAIFPFVVGLISQRAGSFVVLPVFIALYSSMLFLWICLPNVERRRLQPNINFSIWQRIW